MGAKSAKRIKLYKSLDEFPILNMDEAMNGDMYQLVKRKRDRKKADLEKCSERFNELYDEWCRLTESNEMLQLYTLMGHINHLDASLQIAPELLRQLVIGKPKEIHKLYIEELGKWGFIIDQRKDLYKEVDRITNQFKARENKLKRKIAELERIKQSDRKAMTIREQKAKLHTILKVDINLKKTTCTEWLAYWREVEIQSNLNKKQDVK